MDKKTLDRWLSTLTKISIILEDYECGGIKQLQELYPELDNIIDEIYNEIKRQEKIKITVADHDSILFNACEIHLSVIC